MSGRCRSDVDRVCTYSYRTATKCCRNLRFRPQFCEGFGFASHCLDSNPQKPVRAPFGSRLQLPTAPPPNTFHLSLLPGNFESFCLRDDASCCNAPSSKKIFTFLIAPPRPISDVFNLLKTLFLVHFLIHCSASERENSTRNLLLNQRPIPDHPAARSRETRD